MRRRKRKKKALTKAQEIAAIERKWRTKKNSKYYAQRQRKFKTALVGIGILLIVFVVAYMEHF